MGVSIMNSENAPPLGPASDSGAKRHRLQTGSLTRRRLDNDYWEGQLYFATVSLVIAACGVPFVMLRLFRRVPYLCLFGWLIVAAGYSAMTIYMVQSHFPAVSQIIFGSLGATGLLIAIRGLVADIRHIDSLS